MGSRGSARGNIRESAFGCRGAIAWLGLSRNFSKHCIVKQDAATQLTPGHSVQFLLGGLGFTEEWIYDSHNLQFQQLHHDVLEVFTKVVSVQIISSEVGVKLLGLL